jgi:hypothetical protein
MFKNLKNLIWVSLLVIIILSLSLAGCSGGDKSSSTTTSSSTSTTSIPVATSTTSTSSAATTNPVTTSSTSAMTSTTSATTTVTQSQTASKDLVKNATSAWAKLVSYQYDLKMVMKMSGTVSGKPQNTNITLTGNGGSNVTTNEMQLTGNMDIESPGMGKMSMPMVTYLINGWQYTKVSVPMVGEQWIKSKVDLNSFDAQDDSQHVVDILQSATDVTLKGSEDVNGTPCNVLVVTPDQTLMVKMLKSMLSSSGTPSDQINLDYAKAVKSLSIKEWVAKDTNILKKCEITTTLVLTGTDLGTGQASDNLNVDINESVILDKYNQTFTITLPPESQNAKEMSAQK